MKNKEDFGTVNEGPTIILEEGAIDEGIVDSREVSEVRENIALISRDVLTEETIAPELAQQIASFLQLLFLRADMEKFRNNLFNPKSPITLNLLERERFLNLRIHTGEKANVKNGAPDIRISFRIFDKGDRYVFDVYRENGDSVNGYELKVIK